MPVPLLILAIKITIDYRIITRFITLTKADAAMKYFWLSELIHFPVILIAVAGSFFGSFEWKGRLMEREISRHM